MHMRELDTSTIECISGELWPSKQRNGHSLHEVPYRACFRPELAEFFINKYTERGDVVFDSFMGRGTTLLQAALMGRIPYGCDINPLSAVLLSPRLAPPTLERIEDRLFSLCLLKDVWVEDELLVFYHETTLRRIMGWKNYFRNRAVRRELDDVDRWIRMVITTRLHGHSPGFLSARTLPPNQAISVESQRKLNAKHDLAPEPKDIAEIIMKKSRAMLKDVAPSDIARLRTASHKAKILTATAADVPAIPDSSVSLVITSPPFLDIVNYKQDNWLRCWFNGINADELGFWQFKKIEHWVTAMAEAMIEMRRVLKPGGRAAIEVGEVRKGSDMLMRGLIEAAGRAGMAVECSYVNNNKFTKTSRVWNISSDRGSTTNMVLVLRK